MKNYTTTIKAQKSKSEIEEFLAKNGATRILTDYDQQGNPIALSFCMVSDAKGKDLYFRLPCRVEGIHSYLQLKRSEAKFKTWQHALNVGWRILKDWVEIQVSLIESEMTDFEEVFLPYLITADNETLYDKFLESDSNWVLLSAKNE